MVYRNTRKADQDTIDVFLRGAAEYGADQAERYHHGLVAVFALLAENPNMARERTDFRPPVRLDPYQAHLIVYVDHNDGILIARVLHGRQDWERHL